MPLKPRRAGAQERRAVRDIKRYQSSVQPLLPGTPFRRLAKAIANELRGNVRFNKTALHALQEGAEACLVEKFQHWNRAAQHAGRGTVSVQDVEMCREGPEPGPVAAEGGI